MTVAVAPDEAPVIVSAVEKSVAPNPSSNTYDIGLDVSIILALALVDEPVILSPLTKVPTILVIVSFGVTGLFASWVISPVDCESKTAWSLNTSARPRDISLSVALIPYAPSSSADNTCNCLDRFVVLIFPCTLVLVIVAITFTLAVAPKIVLSVIVIEEPPSPLTFVSFNKTISPATPVPPPASIIVNI